jgi:endonuclease YncB( thermonuclease family)
VRLCEAERSAKQAKRGMWLNYVPQVRGTTGCSAD